MITSSFKVQFSIACWPVLMLLSSCSPDFTLTQAQTEAPEPAGHGHDHGEEKTAQITVWSDRFELFVEHAFVVANVPTQFITHVSDLVTLHPRREGPVTFVLEGPSGVRQEHVEAQPARAGIYLPDLSFPSAGMWNLSLRIPLDGEEFTVSLPPIKVYANDHDVAHASEAAAPEGISFLKEQQWKILSKTEPVRRSELSEQIRLTGSVRAVPGRRALVTPPAEGRLLRVGEKALPFIGDDVRRDEVLASLQPVAASALPSLALDLQVKSAEIEGRMLEAQAALEKADQALSRARGLFDQKAVSAKAVEEAEFARRQAAAELSSARALMQSYEAAAGELRTRQPTSARSDAAPTLPLTSPIAGRIVSVEAVEGEFVSPSKPVFTVLDASTVLIEARVPESELLRIRPGAAASYSLPGASDDLIPVLDGGSGRFLLLGSEVDVATRTAPLLYEVPNTDGRLRIGLALTVFVETERSEDALVVPLSAIVEEEGQKVAYVQLGGETFERRDVKLGIRSGERVQVVSGVSEGERVVTKGAYAVRLASVSSVIPAHGHAH